MGISNPWLGFRQYEESDSARFKGRDREIGQLLDMVVNHEITVCYAESGAGKSSIIKAGIFPRLRSMRYFPVPVKIDYDSLQSGKISLAECIYNSIDDAIKSQNEKHADTEQSYTWLTTLPEKPSIAQLWADLRLHQIVRTYEDEVIATYIPVLVFDQFEAVFYKLDTQHTTAVFEDLKTLIINRMPEGLKLKSPEPVSGKSALKILIALREEYVGQLDYYASAKVPMPSVIENKFFLRPLTEAAARQVITDQDIDTLNGVADDIIAVAKERNHISSILLSVICRSLYDNAKTDADGSKIPVTSQEVKVNQDKIIEDYYQDQIKSTGISPRVMNAIEHVLVNSDGKRRLIATDKDTLSKLGFNEHFKDLLESAGIVRGEQINGESYVEIIHDRVADAIFRKRQQQKESKRKNIAFIIALIAGVLLFVVSSTVGIWRAYTLTRTQATTACITHQYLGKYLGVKTPSMIVDNCPNLRTIKVSPQTKENLSIRNCPQLTSIVFEGDSLSSFYVRDCPNLHILHLPGNMDYINIDNEMKIEGITFSPHTDDATYEWFDGVLWMNKRPVYINSDDKSRYFPYRTADLPEVDGIKTIKNKGVWIDNMLFNSDTTDLICSHGAFADSVLDLTKFKKLKTIDRYAFYGNPYIKTILVDSPVDFTVHDQTHKIKLLPFIPKLKSITAVADDKNQYPDSTNYILFSPLQGISTWKGYSDRPLESCMLSPSHLAVYMGMNKDIHFSRMPPDLKQISVDWIMDPGPVGESFINLPDTVLSGITLYVPYGTRENFASIPEYQKFREIKEANLLQQIYNTFSTRLISSKRFISYQPWTIIFFIILIIGLFAIFFWISYRLRRKEQSHKALKSARDAVLFTFSSFLLWFAMYWLFFETVIKDNLISGAVATVVCILEMVAVYFSLKKRTNVQKFNPDAKRLSARAKRLIAVASVLIACVLVYLGIRLINYEIRQNNISDDLMTANGLLKSDFYNSDKLCKTVIASILKDNPDINTKNKKIIDIILSKVSSELALDDVLLLSADGQYLITKKGLFDIASMSYKLENPLFNDINLLAGNKEIAAWTKYNTDSIYVLNYGDLSVHGFDTGRRVRNLSVAADANVIACGLIGGKIQVFDYLPDEGECIEHIFNTERESGFADVRLNSVGTEFAYTESVDSVVIVEKESGKSQILHTDEYDKLIAFHGPDLLEMSYNEGSALINTNTGHAQTYNNKAPFIRIWPVGSRFHAVDQNGNLYLLTDDDLKHIRNIFNQNITIDNIAFNEALGMYIATKGSALYFETEAVPAEIMRNYIVYKYGDTEISEEDIIKYNLKTISPTKKDETRTDE